LAGSAFDRARLTVVPRRRTRAAKVPFIALVSLILLGGVVGLLLFNTSMQQASFAAANLEDRATTLAARQQALTMELDRLRDPQRIATAAQRLGMVQACNPVFLELDSGHVAGEPCVSTPADRLRINPLPPAKPAALNPRAHVVYVDPPAGDEKAQHGKKNKSQEDTGAGNSSRGDRDGKKKNHQSH
jgi:hypothetical protein